MSKYCGKEKCEYWERDNNNNCRMMMDISLCNREPFLTAKTDAVADVPCNDGLAGDKLIEEFKGWAKAKIATKDGATRKFDKGYKFALEDALGKLRTD